MSLLNKASLIQIPSGYKDGTLYGAKPTNGDGDFTFSRGSNLAATRVNSDGLIEKGRENLLLQSNQFDTTWVTANSSVTSGQSGYDGSNDAWLLDKSGASGRITQTKSVTGIFTFSVYVKKGTTDWILLYKTGTGEGGRFFDLTNGVTGSSISTAPIDSKIESVGNDWYRCSIVGNSANAVVMYVADSDGSLTDTSGNILIQDSQLELGLVATDYIETGASTAQAGILEDMPRLDYSGGATCPSCLLEPQRSNLITQSEYIDSFTKTRCTITQNALISPEGLTNAAKITQITSTAWGGIVSTYAPSSPATLSVFAKKIDNDFIAVIGHNSNDTKAYFDLANGTVGTIGTDATSALIEDFGNGWYRCIMTATTVNRYTILHVTTDGGSTAPIGSETALWGCQLEQSASYPTSYIPTYGASVTRGADNCSKTGISSLIGQTEGTMFWDLETTNTDLYKRLSLNDGSTTNWIFLGIELATGVCRGYVKDSGTIQADMTGSIDLTGDRIKLALAYGNNDFVLYANGSQVATDTSGTVPSCNRIDVGSQNPASDVNAQSTTNQAILFPTRLSNDELATLTTL